MPERIEAHGEICATDPCQTCELEALRAKCALLAASLKKQDTLIDALVPALEHLVRWQLGKGRRPNIEDARSALALAARR